MYRQHFLKDINLNNLTSPDAIKLPGGGVFGVSVVITGGSVIFLPVIIRIWCVFII